MASILALLLLLASQAAAEAAAGGSAGGVSRDCGSDRFGYLRSRDVYRIFVNGDRIDDRILMCEALAFYSERQCLDFGSKVEEWGEIGRKYCGREFKYDADLGRVAISDAPNRDILRWSKDFKKATVRIPNCLPFVTKNADPYGLQVADITRSDADWKMMIKSSSEDLIHTMENQMLGVMHYGLHLGGRLRASLENTQVAKTRLALTKNMVGACALKINDSLAEVKRSNAEELHLQSEVANLSAKVESLELLIMEKDLTIDAESSKRNEPDNLLATEKGKLAAFEQSSTPFVPDAEYRAKIIFSILGLWSI